jgi:hypothetical protein
MERPFTHVHMMLVPVVKGGIHLNKKLFQNVEKKTGVQMNDVLKVAQKYSNANFQDEKTVRELVQQVGRLANKKVPKEMEDKIVQMLKKDGKSIDAQTISKMINKK